tara:strand:- start:257 stop:382 length:126 start_codon:yes stop_codon:yes gene_type:complete
MLRRGTPPPKEFSRPEVANILVEWAQSGDLENKKSENEEKK